MIMFLTAPWNGTLFDTSISNEVNAKSHIFSIFTKWLVFWSHVELGNFLPGHLFDYFRVKCLIIKPCKTEAIKSAVNIKVSFWYLTPSPCCQISRRLNNNNTMSRDFVISTSPFIISFFAFSIVIISIPLPSLISFSVFKYHYLHILSTSFIIIVIIIMQ